MLLIESEHRFQKKSIDSKSEIYLRNIQFFSLFFYRFFLMIEKMNSAI